MTDNPHLIRNILTFLKCSIPVILPQLEPWGNNYKKIINLNLTEKKLILTLKNPLH